MKNEVINSFAEGLVSDLNELNTPNKVMTDALNATLITFNGNEFSLQNDMGNAKVGTAYLPKGYVPVGMKEHGGIIYVASHNPDTGRGQIGCFPSPQELWSDEDGEIAEIVIDFTKLLETITQTNLGSTESFTYLQVKNEFYRENIFLDSETYEPRIFHPGDKFIITCSSLDNIAELLSKGVLTLKLASVGTDGVLNYIDNSKLNIYNYTYTVPETESKIEYNFESFIYVMPKDNTNDNTNGNINDKTKTLLKDNEHVQVFPGTSSGKLMLIVEYNVYDTFDLSWSFDNTTGLKAVFTGSTTGNLDYEGLYNLNSGIISTHKPGQLNTEPIIKITPDNNTINYNIAPYSKYGIVERLIRSGSINVANLTEKGNIDQWSYFVGNDYIDITWSFQYLDINGKEAQSMRFVFIPLEAINDANCNVELDIAEWYNIELEKASYNGYFDEHILFIDGKFEKNSHYVCRTDKTLDGKNWEAVGYEYVHTFTLFNNISVNKLKEYKENPPQINVQYNLEGELNVKETNSRYYNITQFNDEKDNTEYYSELTSVAIIDPKEGNYKFTSGIEKTYEIDSSNVHINPTLSTNENLIIDDSLLSYINTYRLEYSEGNIQTNIININGSTTKNKKSDDISNTGEIIKIYREIQSSSNTIRNKTINNVEMLAPLYNNDICIYQPDTLGNVQAVGIKDAIVKRNVPVSRNTVFINADDPKIGTSLTTDDHAYNKHMSKALNDMKIESASSYNGTFGVITDINSEGEYKNAIAEGSLTIITAWSSKEGADIDNDGNFELEFNVNNKWHRTKNEKGASYQLNYMIPTCESENGNHYLLNLLVPKSDSNNNIKRFYEVMKGILSQLLVVKNVPVYDITYVKPDENNFDYNSLKSTTTIKHTYDLTIEENNQKVNIESRFEEWKNKVGVSRYFPKFVNNYTGQTTERNDETDEVTIKKNITLTLDSSDFNTGINKLISLYSEASLQSYTVPSAHPKVGLSKNEYLDDLKNFGYTDGSKDFDSEYNDFQNNWRKYIYWGDVERVNADGTCILNKDSFGRYKIKTKFTTANAGTTYSNIFGKASTYLADFSTNESITETINTYLQTGNISDYFITNNPQAKIDASHITKVLLKRTICDLAQDEQGEVYWGFGSKHNSKGPLMIKDMHFGGYSLWKPDAYTKMESIT